MEMSGAIMQREPEKSVCTYRRQSQTNSTELSDGPKGPHKRKFSAQNIASVYLVKTREDTPEERVTSRGYIVRFSRH